MIESSIIVIGLLAALFGLLLGYAAIKFKIEGNPLVESANALLPQTQCGQCGYPGCSPYAEAVVAEEAEINLCPPGGEQTMLDLAALLGREPVALEVEEKPPALAVIDEDVCIGCTKCILACPVDAIMGATKLMHTVISQECTGCEKCVEPCPVYCIHMIPIKTTIENWRAELPNNDNSKYKYIVEDEVEVMTL